MHLSESSWVSLKTIVPTFITVLLAALWINSQSSDTRETVLEIKSDQRVNTVMQQNMAQDITDLTTEMKTMRDMLTNNRWTKSDMSQWVERLRTHNPTLNVPTLE